MTSTTRTKNLDSSNESLDESNHELYGETLKHAAVTDNCSSKPKEFSIIWHNLTYKVDSRRWYTKAKERFSHSDRNDFDQNDSTGSIANKKRVILNQVCGEAKSRQLTAIMGPSGSGKSSLLYCLFQNRTSGTSGQILVDSCNKNKLKVCFIPQRDYLNEWLTVREDLIFVSKLKLARINGMFTTMLNNPYSPEQQDQDLIRDESYIRQSGKHCRASLIDHEANAFCVAELLGLTNCLDVPIKNISGGQKKRLSIARELMSKPDILIMDEPTTGLDSLTCYKTIMVLKDLAQHSPNPMAVVVTIHQPQREVFNLFDKTYFISNTGRIILDGSPKNAIKTIEDVAQVTLPIANYNPASFLIEIASDELQGSVIDKLSEYQRTKFYEHYNVSYLKKLMKPKPAGGSQNWRFCTVDETMHSEGSPTVQSSEDIRIVSGGTKPQDVVINEESSLNESELSSEQYFISYQLSNCLSSHSNSLLQSFRHVFILTHRSWLSVIRNPTFTRSRFAFHTILPLMMLIVFGTSMGVPNNCPKLEKELNIQDMKKNIEDGVVAKNIDETRLSVENMSFFFILMYGFGINIISCTASFYPLTMHMFKKETINGLYSAAPYFIGQTLAELPMEILFPSISILLSYPLTGQIPSYLEWRMFAVAYVVFLVSYVIHSLGLLCGSIFVNNVSVALLLGQGLLLPFVMLSGLVIRPPRMAEWMRKLTYISPFKHGLSGIIVARYGFNVCDCDESLLPKANETVRLAGLTPLVRHVVEYMFPSNNTQTDNEIGLSEVFDKLSDRFVKAQTFALDLKSCDEVKPFLMHVLDVENSDLFVAIGCLLVITIALRCITFSIVKSFPYRIN